MLIPFFLGSSISQYLQICFAIRRRYRSRLCDDVAPARVDHLLSEEETNEHQQGPEKRRL